jgi:hypothetical protein
MAAKTNVINSIKDQLRRLAASWRHQKSASWQLIAQWARLAQRRRQRRMARHQHHRRAPLAMIGSIEAAENDNRAPLARWRLARARLAMARRGTAGTAPRATSATPSGAQAGIAASAMRASASRLSGDAHVYRGVRDLATACVLVARLQPLTPQQIAYGGVRLLQRRWLRRFWLLGRRQAVSRMFAIASKLSR